MAAQFVVCPNIQYYMSEEHTEKLPSVTMVVLGYNQEKSIGYAIDSALNQDYAGNLTFVFSDDCSTDGTYAVMQKKAAEYKGPHKIILNRNTVNKQHAGNLSTALSLAPADYYCKQDGDDYSSPQRVSALVNAFLQNKRVTFALGGVKKVVITTDEGLEEKLRSATYAGANTIRVMTGDGMYVAALGCVCMWPAKVMKVAEQMGFSSWKGIYEDRLLMDFARLFGDVAMVEKELICYVLHRNNASYVDRVYRYSSFSAFKETEKRLEEMNRKYVPVQENAVALLNKCMHDFPDIEVARRRLMEHRVVQMEKNILQMKAVLTCAEKSVVGRMLYWIRHRETGVSVVLPMAIKYAALRAAHAVRNLMKK